MCVTYDGLIYASCRVQLPSAHLTEDVKEVGAATCLFFLFFSVGGRLLRQIC